LIAPLDECLIKTQVSISLKVLLFPLLPKRIVLVVATLEARWAMLVIVGPIWDGVSGSLVNGVSPLDTVDVATGRGQGEQAWILLISSGREVSSIYGEFGIFVPRSRPNP
jgi:hypothetical protein